MYVWLLSLILQLTVWTFQFMDKPEKSTKSDKKSSKLSVGKTAPESHQSSPSNSAGQKKQCKTSGKVSASPSKCRSPTEKSHKVLGSPAHDNEKDHAVDKCSPAKTKEPVSKEPLKSIHLKESLNPRPKEKSPGVEWHGSIFMNKINRGGQSINGFSTLLINYFNPCFYRRFCTGLAHAHCPWWWNKKSGNRNLFPW